MTGLLGTPVPVTFRMPSPVPVPDRGIGGPGEAGTRLLAGPGPSRGAESLAEHVARCGPIPALHEPPVLRRMIEAGGLLGRGGGAFPVAAKLRTALSTGGRPLLVVNAGESEPASRKDRTLCELRPHTVLDGAAALAAAAGTDEVVVHVHRGTGRVAAALRTAFEERAAWTLPDPGWRLSVGPDRYVAGEASAVVSFIGGGPALPSFTDRPLAAGGAGGRPVLVHNAETVAQLALLVRMGPDRWAAGGTPGSPGSVLVTVAGAVGDPGAVREVVGTATVGDVLGSAGVVEVPGAVLVGGYAGSWVEGAAARRTVLSPAALASVGASLGCGLLGVLPFGACGLAETARLVGYLAGESAGQCGPCVYGLADLAADLASLADGTLRRRSAGRIHRLLEGIPGRGACRHPDGVVRMASSALSTFADDVDRHLHGRACPAETRSGWFPVPTPGGHAGGGS